MLKSTVKCRKVPESAEKWQKVPKSAEKEYIVSIYEYIGSIYVGVHMVNMGTLGYIEVHRGT